MLHISTSDKIRIELDKLEYMALKKLLESNKVNISLYEKIHNPKIIKHSEKKIKATEKATATRTQKAKEKIQNAINLLRLEGKTITIYSIAKTGKVSFETVQKYISDEKLKILNRRN